MKLLKNSVQSLPKYVCKLFILWWPKNWIIQFFFYISNDWQDTMLSTIENAKY